MAAEASIPVKYVDDITECPICTEVYTDPRVLPCIHTYCLKCITAWGRDKQPGDTVACPLCRKEVKIPEGGLGELQKNIFVEKLLEAKRMSGVHATAEQLCEVCDDAGSARKVVMFCADCQQNMCQQCAASHMKIRLTKSHKLVEVSGQSEGDKALLLASDRFCDKHDDKRLEIYCFNCKLVVCMLCFVKDHKAHEGGDVKEVSEECGRNLKTDVGLMVKKVAECREVLTELTRVDLKCADHVEKTELKICERAEEMKRLIGEYKDNLVSELRTAKKTRDKELESVKYELEGHMMMTESLRQYSDELAKKGTACDIVRAESDLRRRGKELTEFNVSELGSELTDFKRFQRNVTFDFGDATDKLKNLFGYLCTETG